MVNIVFTTTLKKNILNTISVLPAAISTEPRLVLDTREIERESGGTGERRLEDSLEDGKAACPALAEAALGPSREVTLRAIDILRKQLKSGDMATKEAAKEALQEIVDSDHESAARRAKDALARAVVG